MIRLLIADDHPIVREGLKRILASDREMTIVGEAIDGTQVLSEAKCRDVDVVLLDISMPGPGFLDTLRRLRALRPKARVLVLSVHPEDQYALRAIRSGAAGYLTKDHSPGELTEAIRRVHGGRRYVTPSLAERLAEELETPERRLPHESLSDREYQIFMRLADGQSVKAISDHLNLSPKTVSTYRRRVLDKLQLDGNSEVIRYAFRHGLVE